MKGVIFLSLILISTVGNCQKNLWGIPIRAGSSCNSVTYDLRGNLFIAGDVNNEVTNQKYFNNYELPLNPQCNQYSYLIKSDTSFNIKWIKLILSEGFGIIKIIADAEKNIILIGKNNGFINMDSYSSNKSGTLLAKFSNNGDLQWVRNIYGICLPYDLTLDNENSIYFGGYAIDNLSFYNHGMQDTIVDILGQWIFFAKYDKNGKFQWTKTTLNQSQSRLNDLEVDEDRNIYITGSWFEGSTFDGIKKTLINSEIFIAKYNSNQQIQWLKQIGDPKTDYSVSGRGLAIDNNLKCIYVTGGFAGTVDFGNMTLQSNDKNIFLASYDFNGDLRWVKNMGYWSGFASSIEYGSNLLVDEGGMVYLTGILGQGGDFDGVSISAYDNTANSNLYVDQFIAKFTSAGKLIWVDHLGHPDYNDQLFSLSKYRSILTIGGQTRPNAIFGNNILINDNNYYLGYVCNINTSLITDINDIISTETYLDFYPNPAKDEIYFRLNNNSISLDVKIFDLQGRLIKAKCINQDEPEIDISDLLKGTYFLRLSNSLTRMLIKI